jgi:outer membrane receptor protein involved in Fe transport
MKRRVSVIALGLLLALTTMVRAQETKGSIEGVVKDSSGGLLPGVTVEAASVAQTGTVSAVTDGNGKYRFPALAPGRYEITANLTGFQASKVENVQLLLGQVLQVNFALQVGGVSESVQVNAEAPLIDVKQNAAAASIQKDVIDLIPKGRDFTSVVNFAPGARDESKGGGIQIDGSSGSENRFVIDGLDTTSLRTGVSASDLRTDFVAEVQVKSGGYNAEYRAATGGVISAITRTGSNAWHGSVGSYFDSDKLQGDPRPALRLKPTNTREAELTYNANGTTRHKLDNQSNVEPVFDIGGPIFRDRLWFFAGYLPQIQRWDRTVRFGAGGDPRTFNRNSEVHNINYNVTGQLSQNLRAKFAASHQPTVGGQTMPAIEENGTSNSTASQFPNLVTTNNFTDSYAANFDWVVSPKFFMSLNTGFLTYGGKNVTTGEFPNSLRHTFTGENSRFSEIPADLVHINGYSDFAASTRQVRDDYTRFGFNLDGTYYANFAGQHTLKAGVQFERLGNDVLTGAQAPTVALNWNASWTTLDNRTLRGTYGYYVVNRIYTEGNVHSNNLGLFVQDAWTVNNKLTLNLGIRTEKEDIPSYRPENPGIHFGWADKIAPRVGFAYDVTGDGKWKTYGSFGMFYDITKLQMPRGSFGADRWISYYYTLDTFNWPAINCEGPAGSGCVGNFIEQIDFRHVSNDPGSSAVDPNMKPISERELMFGADHELNRTMSVGVRYTHKTLDRTIEDVGIAVPGVGEFYFIANPGEGLTQNLLRNFNASTLRVEDGMGLCPTCPDQPKPKREYDGVEFRFTKRLANNWSAILNYRLSRLYGNYSGLASSDENGRVAPNVNRYFDLTYNSFDQDGNPVEGRLPTDRPHEFKAQFTYNTPWGTNLGVQYYLASGTPLQTQTNVKNVPVYISGRGDLGRTPVFSQTDLNVSHVVRFGGKSIVLMANVLNLFDQEIMTNIFNTKYRDNLNITDAAFFAGFNADAIAAANTSIRPDPRYGLANTWQGPRAVRVQAKFMF